jgi:6,7-dimethyl-8-ribityllumazine synthase
MPHIIEADTNAAGLTFAIIASRFHDQYVSGLIEGAVDCLQSHGAASDRIVIIRVPGAFEVPAVADRLAARGGYDALIALGVLIRGDTPHFDFISSQVTLEISRVSIRRGIPLAYGVITCLSAEQARNRSGKEGNKGWEAALAAIEMTNLYRLIKSDK